jgi:quercetin 2,3-dioxygenase
VNLPASSKWVDPRYQDIDPRAAVLLASEDGGALVRVIAGEVAGHKGPGLTHTPIALVHATLAPGARLVLPWSPEFNALAYGLAGHGSVGEDRRPFAMGQLAVLGAGDAIVLEADQAQDLDVPALDVLVLGGTPIREPVAAYGPFVMNTRAELAQAFEDYQAGRLGTVPADHIGD